jgi:hypothetical protein
VVREPADVSSERHYSCLVSVVPDAYSASRASRPPRTHANEGEIMAKKKDSPSGNRKGEEKGGMPGGHGGNGQSGTDQGKTDSSKKGGAGYGSTGAKGSGGTGSSQGSGGGSGGTHG